ncbi:hypothetical protein DM42_7277 [Burkholderia cepacia]|nr:hypothetical protein DM42_7277 [Burkholderia cepacia]
MCMTFLPSLTGVTHWSSLYLTSASSATVITHPPG